MSFVTQFPFLPIHHPALAAPWCRRKKRQLHLGTLPGPSLTCKIPQNHLGRLFLARDLLLQLHSEGSGTTLPPALEARLVSLEDRTWALLGCPPGPGGASFPSVTLSPRLGDAQGLPLWGCPGSHSPLQAPAGRGSPG